MTVQNVFIVTGSSRGIGSIVACELACPNTAIVITYHASEEPANVIAEKVKQKGAQCITLLGRLRGWLNNAGVRHAGAFESMKDEDYATVFDNDVKSCIFMTCAAVPHMTEGGSIVNISSSVTHCPFADQTVYTAGKGAIDAFTRAASLELASRNIRINTVSPGFTDTDMLPEEQYELGKKMAPLGRVGSAEDIANVVAFFISPKSGWVTGQNVLASGGFGFAM
ncbi:hypothetical protein BC829DRAFT_373180 [Chytridium lagenaria]|nr:hypothetical protein BC829DRAFT_373180 [Chytridium lagenaria]